MLYNVRRKVVALSFALACMAWQGVSLADTPEGLAHFIMGSCFGFQDKNDAALLEYAKAAEKDPSSFPIQIRLGVAAAEAGSPRLAIDAFRAALQIKPDDLEVRYLLAVTYSAVKEFDHAAEQYEFILRRFTAADPHNADYFLYLGQLYLTQGKVKEAVSQFEKVLELQPGNKDLLLEVGTYYLENGRRKDGIGLLKQCVAKNPSDAPCLNALGYTYAEDRVLLNEASRMVDAALKQEPDNPAYLDSLGWVRYQEGRLSEALVLLKKAFEKDKDALILDHMGDVYQKMNRLDLAVESWGAALKLDGALKGVTEKILAVEKKLKKNKH